MQISKHEEPMPALQRKAERLHQNPDLATPSSKKQKVMPFEMQNRASKSKKQSLSKHHLQPEAQRCQEIDEEVEGEESERAEVEEKISTLQRIVPGGEDLGVEKLFEETAEYILSLQWQIKAMRALTTFFEGLERNTRKLGG
ncbi:hypothetical protein SAY87_020217 [Trapa incisa]|uniref:Uncharacterized protein n=1 Tax=Trapa incisa TaxID=236973 RepID=A0AAN7K687_9MYRT|nr:hypothetical protein SAY87_020217 [Trapa incisa]